MASLQLDRPLAVFDIEATGVNPRTDRIVELAIHRLHPDGSRDRHVFRINPEMPIPPEVSEIHGITDADVADCPTFEQRAEEVEALLAGCDLCGYNVLRFDIPMLEEEFLRAKKRFDATQCRVVDAQRIFHRREPRDLSAALRYYCGDEHADAHGADADVDATIRVLEGQLRMYEDLPRDVAALDAYCNPRDPDWTDRTGRLRWVDGEITINFGKKKGMLLRQLAVAETSYLRWILRSDFPRDTQDIVREALEGRFPEPPDAAKPTASGADADEDAD